MISKKKKKKKKKRSSPKFRVIFRPKSKIQTFFPPKIRWSPKKKGLRQNSGRFFIQFRKFKRLRGALFVWGGGLFSIFHRKSASKAQKTCDFAYFTSQWGSSSPPLATLLVATLIWILCKSSIWFIFLHCEQEWCSRLAALYISWIV